ncbi:hypothetical protein BDP81DRAFT_473951 [Colletotrichum phormii]|uniref:Uncharacterized protein n=1 Tax=Colletotrichum phormii TaxID=359342 RepID=A0AAJ0EB67_9PEZI|nr:uncharacterized protein BDP81DRAFT_473951 [Colletotrichum phormii]KAK1633292.1 hypothetical protein BDP81DRAFT_473951 [Colletotrichum phormii]
MTLGLPQLVLGFLSGPSKSLQELIINSKGYAFKIFTISPRFGLSYCKPSSVSIQTMSIKATAAWMSAEPESLRCWLDDLSRCLPAQSSEGLCFIELQPFPRQLARASEGFLKRTMGDESTYPPNNLKVGMGPDHREIRCHVPQPSYPGPIVSARVAIFEICQAWCQKADLSL